LKILNIRQHGRHELDSLSKRATPAVWTKYSLASTVIKLYNSSDAYIVKALRESSYVNDRMPYKDKFFGKFKYKVGRQSLPNRIGSIFSDIK
jgi:hypothetical protein